MTAPATPLFTDLYQLTMMQGYRSTGLHRKEACFDLFFRHHPFRGGYSIAAGLEDALTFLETARFDGSDLDYLRSLGLFAVEFLDGLRAFGFSGTVHAVMEGTVVFPNAPVLRVEGPMDECQLVESSLLNIVNFQSLIATKAARVCQEVGGENVMEFGLRRAQGPDGALTASRAAYIGGCASTSNVLAGKVHGIPVGGTHAHSWVMAFDSELEAFRAFARIYPRDTVLLTDTYDTLRSGVPNAIRVALEMRERGESLKGIRLDSGDLAYLSIEARRMLDEAGLDGVKIVCSGDLDEHILHDMKAQGARIDLYGVGTNLATAQGDPAFPGVYKMAALRDPGGPWEMKLKIADGRKKSTLPGVKQVWRLHDASGEMMADWIELEDAAPADGAADFTKGVVGHHPVLTYQKKRYDGIAAAVPLLEPVFKGGRRLGPPRSLGESRERVRAQLAGLHPTMRRLLNPHIYKVSIGPRLMQETDRLRSEPEDGAGDRSRR